MFLVKILGKVIGKVFFGHPNTDWGLGRKDDTKEWFAELSDGVITFACVMIKHAIREKPGSGKIIFAGDEYTTGKCIIHEQHSH